MKHPLDNNSSSLAPNLSAPQHKPRPLTLFMEMLRSETAGDTGRMRKALAGLRAYQEANREPALEAKPAIFEWRGAKLRDYGGAGPPALFVPSLINPPNILDLSEDKSLLRWLSARGHRVLLLDWGCDSLGRRDLSIAGHVEKIVVSAMREIGKDVALVGYCIGGTMAIAAASMAPCRKLATIAAPWRFDGFPENSRSLLQSLWSNAEPVTTSLGLFPMEVLQAAFWSLDPARTISKFEAFAEVDPASLKARAFVTLEDWANDGPPLPEAAARELFEGFFREDRPGNGRWAIRGEFVEPKSLSCPQLHIGSSVDKIVPQASEPPSGEHVTLAQGHVGMVIGSHARTSLWEPLSAWLL